MKNSPTNTLLLTALGVHIHFTLVKMNMKTFEAPQALSWFIVNLTLFACMLFNVM